MQISSPHRLELKSCLAHPQLAFSSRYSISSLIIAHRSSVVVYHSRIPFCCIVAALLSHTQFQQVLQRSLSTFKHTISRSCRFRLIISRRSSFSTVVYRIAASSGRVSFIYLISQVLLEVLPFRSTSHRTHHQSSDVCS